MGIHLLANKIYIYITMLLAFLTTVYSSPYIRKLETGGCVDKSYQETNIDCENRAYEYDCNHNAEVMLACPAKCQERGYRDCSFSVGCVDKSNFDCAGIAYEWACQNTEEVTSSCCFTCFTRFGNGPWGGEETTTKVATSTTKVATSSTKVATSTTKVADADLGYCTVAHPDADQLTCINLEEFKCNDYRDDQGHKACFWKIDNTGKATTSGTCTGDEVCKYAKNSYACIDLKNYGPSRCEWYATNYDVGYCTVASAGVDASFCIQIESHDECNNSTDGQHGRPCVWEQDDSGETAMPGTCSGEDVCGYAKTAFACNGLKHSQYKCEWNETN